MKQRLLLFTFFMLGLAATVFPQSLLWKISGKNLQSPSYFYGTFHIQDERVYQFDSKVNNAINSCDAFAVEVLLDEVNTSKANQLVQMPKGKTLTELLSKEDFAILDSLCKAKLGASAIFMNGMKPFFIATTLQQVDMPAGDEPPLDMYLLHLARAAGKSCYGLETFEEQMKAVDAIGLEEQAKMLQEMLHDTANASLDEMEETLLAYRNFDIDKLQGMTQDTTLPKKFGKVLVDKRNTTMMKRFVKIAKNQTLFCAVGAGHLGGEKGVLALLRKKGYTVEPVIFNWVEKK